jgi:hypothetical protein
MWAEPNFLKCCFSDLSNLYNISYGKPYLNGPNYP